MLSSVWKFENVVASTRPRVQMARNLLRFKGLGPAPLDGVWTRSRQLPSARPNRGSATGSVTTPVARSFRVLLAMVVLTATSRRNQVTRWWHYSATQLLRRLGSQTKPPRLGPAQGFSAPPRRAHSLQNCAPHAQGRRRTGRAVEIDRGGSSAARASRLISALRRHCDNGRLSNFAAILDASHCHQTRALLHRRAHGLMLDMGVTLARCERLVPERLAYCKDRHAGVN